MVLKETEEMVQASLCDTILAACRKTVPHNGQLLVEGLLRITADKKEIFLVNVRETLQKGKRRRRSYKPTPTKRKRRRPVIESEDDDGGEEDDFGEDTEVEEEEGVEEEDKVQVKEEPEEVVDKEAGQKESDDETAAGNVALELKNLAAQLADESVSDIAEPKTEETINETNTHDKEEEAREALPVKRKRGRPRKNPIADPDKPRGPPKRRGRKPVIQYSSSSDGWSEDSESDLESVGSVESKNSLLNMLDELCKNEEDTSKMEVHECKQCWIMFETAAGLKRHERMMHGKSGRRRKPRKDEEEELQCDICHKKFQRRAPYRQHMDWHNNRGYKCRHCEKTFVKKNLREAHERLHTNSMFSCKFCKRTFQREGFLKYHVEMEHSGNAVKCKFCDFKSKDMDRLKRHEDTQHGKPYTCSYCGKSFKFKAHVLEHEKIHTGERPFACSICDRRFVKMSNLKEHEMWHLGEKRFTCSYCGKMFMKKSSMRRHELAIHTTERPYQCGICGKHFAYLSVKTEHEKIHAGAKLFPCDICGKRFSTRSNCTTHKRKVHVPKVVMVDPIKQPYKCSYCEKRFTAERSQKKHERIHTGESLHYCSFCGKVFVCLSEKQAHERIHTGEKIYRCDICEESFMHSSTMKAHRSKVHPEVPNIYTKEMGTLHSDMITQAHVETFSPPVISQQESVAVTMQTSLVTAGVQQQSPIPTSVSVVSNATSLTTLSSSPLPTSLPHTLPTSLPSGLASGLTVGLTTGFTTGLPPGLPPGLPQPPNIPAQIPYSVACPEAFTNRLGTPPLKQEIYHIFPQTAKIENNMFGNAQEKMDA